MTRVLVIAEAGVNHCGDPDMALRLVDAAADAGADVVKFQTFSADKLAGAGAPKAAYQDRNDPTHASQLDMLRALELPHEAFVRIIEHCRTREIGFLSTPFDLGSVDFLVGTLGVPTIKIGSGDLTNAPLLHHAARSGKELIVSTGMSEMDEVEEAMGVIALALGYGPDGAAPAADTAAAAWADPAARAAVAARTTVLHCTSQYPAAPDAVNLQAMVTMRDVLGVPVGYSDHTLGIAVSVAAVAMGARAIEKHLTLDRNLDGPDHLASLEPEEMGRMIAMIRETEAALGDGIKRPHPSELDTRKVARQSLVAARPISAGALFSRDDLTTMRVGGGMAPIQLWQMVGRPASKAYEPGETIAEPLHA